ncbi:hypothetical protein [Streptomyces sp. NBC_01236]|uniref:hypothetical protein n=1 Tax=Streptomyces sp. NBC_01236 TaxID=2903789 RepID=UPI002E1214AF|nr:hypothetical protein OG324_00740 [Streptomyces sp. NBC_01236]
MAQAYQPVFGFAGQRQGLAVGFLVAAQFCRQLHAGVLHAEGHFRAGPSVFVGAGQVEAAGVRLEAN